MSKDCCSLEVPEQWAAAVQQVLEVGERQAPAIIGLALVAGEHRQAAEKAAVEKAGLPMMVFGSYC